MSWYDRWVLPRILDAACGLPAAQAQRARVLGRARGVVLEPGIGGGLNLPLYRPDQVTRVVGVDPSVELGNLARRRSAAVPFPVEVLSRSAEVDAVPAGSVDTVVFTYTLCTLPDPASALAAAHRALKPDGILLFCEHARAPDAHVYRWQRRLEPLWKRLAGGCHLTREPARTIRAAGFHLLDLEEHYAEAAPRIAGFHQLGCADRSPPPQPSG